jgi:hypothetical protein
VNAEHDSKWARYVIYAVIVFWVAVIRAVMS